jgi:hypothetical protein
MLDSYCVLCIVIPLLRGVAQDSFSYLCAGYVKN